MQVRLTQVLSAHDSLRTNVVLGECKRLPEIGKSLVITADAIEPMFDKRLIVTSPIAYLFTSTTLKYYILSTENSVYRLDILE